MRFASRWFKQIIIVVAVLGLLTSAWPGVAQGTWLVSTHSTVLTNVSLLTFVSCANVSNLEIYTASADGANLAQRTNTLGSNYVPRFNNNASQIVFISTRDGNQEIYIMGADGSNQTRLTNTPENEAAPTWSPDGSKIAFSALVSGNTDIYVMNADGTGRTRLTTRTAEDTSPTWSPNGTQIAFLSGFGSSDMDLWFMTANGSGQHLLASASLLDSPRWSPDGTRLAVTADGNSDGWTEVAYLNTDGTGLTFPAGFASNSYTHFTPAWSPDSQAIAFANEYWPLVGGTYSMTASYIDAVNLNDHSITRLIPTSCFVSPDWQTSDSSDLTPPTSTASSPAHAVAPQFLVTWSGSDATSGVASYDIQYRDGALDQWIDWITSTTQTALQFNGQLGHTYYFQSRARDKAGNLEAYPNGEGDTLTTTPLYALTGTIKGNRAQAIALAQAQTTPAALNQVKTDHLGNFTLYYNLSGTLSLSATRTAFGTLPPMLNVVVSDTSSSPIIYLPPLDDQISDGHFESGNLSAWNPSGLLIPTITTTAHTGSYAAILGGSVPSDMISSGPYLSTIEQTITVPLTLTDGTLSLLYKVTAADPLSDTLIAYLVGPADTLTLTLPITVADWTHQWFDVSAWTAPTATLRLELSTPDKERAVGVLIDEVTWGSFVGGSHPIYLPIIAR
ncbi:MAG: PD40 domain-containing protein [Chloroflexi bacterium]|nr:PD40 domain-containing protein [Chloroflexota bacterium]